MVGRSQRIVADEPRENGGLTASALIRRPTVGATGLSAAHQHRFTASDAPDAGHYRPPPFPLVFAPLLRRAAKFRAMGTFGEFASPYHYKVVKAP